MNYLRKFLLIIFPLIPLYVSGQNVYFRADTTIGCDSLTVTFQFINTSFPDTISTVSWNFGNGQTATGKGNQVVLYEMAGLYTVSIVVNNNTIITRPDYISIYPAPDPGFQFSDSLELGSYTILFWSDDQAVDTIGYSWLWEFEDGETASTRSVIHTFPSEGTRDVGLTITSEPGCSAHSVQMIDVIDVLKWPNVFTPNDDNMNDNFVILSNGVTVYSIRIFSRSGVQVYRSESPTIIWDGRNQSGQELPPDVYFFTIKALDDTQRPEQSGFVHLYREKGK
jgi:gliding motility-associated-like protein